MKKVLVTGSQGQLGHCIREIAADYPQLNFVFTDKDELDITDSTAVAQFLASKKFDYCINAAAYTLVEQAEEDEETAYLVNAKAAGILAGECDRSDCVLIHISTDYVFDGKKTLPYTEDDPTAPLSVYGASKLAGERLVQKNCRKHFIFRTSWLYSLYGHNFLLSISKWLAEGRSLNITTEQTGTPTNAHELSSKVLGLISGQNQAYGLYHLSNEGEATWYDFARQIAINTAGVDSSLIGSVDHYPTKARRPDYSVLSNERAKNALNMVMDPWEVSLQKLLER
ncbi:dTDP-4-dehydrorhamnose reductase [Aureitalea marina]|uniref:dTDP-4-dehydrorhamnose reductase n=1 Tax=Aureitalea marina TaxID=930804 RepID=A0A2S7KSC4_9FLAO|nr:dTDP-4-dehydrorhamnose reductase [Aureitalea marina]PQB05478.1 dTDP-4-dehydrorhamnose reductase [Aureitalea marina]